jgi:hypothetical protein
MENSLPSCRLLGGVSGSELARAEKKGHTGQDNIKPPQRTSLSRMWFWAAFQELTVPRIIPEHGRVFTELH